MECDDISSNNGLVLLKSYFIPEEVLAKILSFVDPHTLVHRCRYVCRVWRDVISDKEVWKLMLIHSKLASLSKLSTRERKQIILNFPWYFNYLISRQVPFEQNLLRNNCGQQKLMHWRVITPRNLRRPGSGRETGLPLGSGYWDVESLPIYADPLPKNDDFAANECCFSTSYDRCVKRQQIDLWGRGFPSKLLDEFQPPIIVSEWYAGRYDCGCKYALRIELLNTYHESIVPVQQEERYRAQWQGREWNKVSLTFENYGLGLRYVVFQHEGIDTQFWAGNYGSKMAGGVVKVCFPKILPRDHGVQP